MVSEFQERVCHGILRRLGLTPWFHHGVFLVFVIDEGLLGGIPFGVGRASVWDEAQTMEQKIGLSDFPKRLQASALRPFASRRKDAKRGLIED
ncbi:MAG: hypothetical protein NZM37_04415 [Sandaracinaceae bacterium]|nr:hypothetical protein [Sandaracinaceae bacterium]